MENDPKYVTSRRDFDPTRRCRRLNRFQPSRIRRTAGHRWQGLGSTPQRGFRFVLSQPGRTWWRWRTSLRLSLGKGAPVALSKTAWQEIRLPRISCRTWWRWRTSLRLSLGKGAPAALSKTAWQEIRLPRISCRTWWRWRTSCAFLCGKAHPRPCPRPRGRKSGSGNG